MIGLLFALILFNSTAFLTNKKLTYNQIIHIWLFTIAFQNLFDVFVDLKYHGYWYFTKEADFKALLVHLFLLPPVNMLFLNWYPHEKKIFRQLGYFIIWVIALLLYELVALLPEPWGYFHYGWWKLIYSAVLNPFLLLIMLFFYKWTCKIEKKAFENH